MSFPVFSGRIARRPRLKRAPRRYMARELFRRVIFGLHGMDGLAGEALLNFGPLGVPFAFLLLAFVVSGIRPFWLTVQPVRCALVNCAHAQHCLFRPRSDRLGQPHLVFRKRNCHTCYDSGCFACTRRGRLWNLLIRPRYSGPNEQAFHGVLSSYHAPKARDDLVVHIPEIDGLRFLTISAIFIYHLHAFLALKSNVLWTVPVEQDWASRLTLHWTTPFTFFSPSVVLCWDCLLPRIT